ncbi:hypothetical protein KCU93_g956, partial [Aureobasidium melanogenum]
MDAITLSTTLKEATSILPLMILLMWNCLLVTPSYDKAHIYGQLFPNFQPLQKWMNDSGIFFAPSLFETLRSSTPALLSFFKSLPSGMHKDILHSIFKNVFAVYVCIMEKGGKWMIYIGSATNADYGLLARSRNYKNLDDNLGSWVKKALAEGWTITHIGLLCWVPLPRLRDQPRLRALFLVLECTFTWTFWSMYARKTYYGMDALCPWKLSSLGYTGLNSQSCLRETPSSDFDLSERQLDTMEKLRTFANGDRNANWRNKKRDEDPVAYNRYRADGVNANNAKAKAKDPEAYKAAWQARNSKSRKKAKDEKKFQCLTCDGKCFTSQYHLDRHIDGPRHKKKVKQMAGQTTLKF